MPWEGVFVWCDCVFYSSAVSQNGGAAATTGAAKRLTEAWANVLGVLSPRVGSSRCFNSSARAHVSHPPDGSAHASQRSSACSVPLIARPTGSLRGPAWAAVAAPQLSINDVRGSPAMGVSGRPFDPTGGAQGRLAPDEILPRLADPVPNPAGHRGGCGQW